VRYDVAVVGGGIVGLATAMALAPRARIVVLEAEERLAGHQSSHNSGVIHSGLYYKPGSLKAELCTAGRAAMYRFCAEEGIPHEACGKLVVATRPEELPALAELERRGRASGLAGLRRIGPEEIREREPEVTGIAGLLVPETGIVDFARVSAAFAARVRAGGAEIRTGARLLAVRREPGEVVLITTAGEVRSRTLVACAGLQSDLVARRCGLDPGLRIVPFRGEFLELVPERRGLVKHLVYPVPDPALPFLGVHFTRTIDGAIEAGPNAVLALARHGYGRWTFSAADAAGMLAYGGFWSMARRHWRAGVDEVHRSFSMRASVKALQALVPALGRRDVRRGRTGVRAQAVAPDGALVDDFRFLEADGMVHVLNAPSPAATASIAIGETIAARVRHALEG
jgi:L-2-hydroxyglutarate oxidase